MDFEFKTLNTPMFEYINDMYVDFFKENNEALILGGIFVYVESTDEKLNDPLLTQKLDNIRFTLSWLLK